jgi:HEAT repeat protein
MPHHAAASLKSAVLEGDTVSCRNACDIILLCRDQHLFQSLSKAIENPRHRNASYVASTVLKLAQLLQEDAAEHSSEDAAGQDPSFARHQMLAALEHTLKLKISHCPAEVIDAFLLLAPNDNRVLLDVVLDTHHPAHSQLTMSLTTNNTPASMRRLVAMMRDTDIPDIVLEAIASRSDQSFVEFLLHELKHPVSLRVLQNMKRLQSVAWLEKDCELLLELSGRAQEIAVDLAMASEIDFEAKFHLLRMLLQHGLGEGRRASCQALASFDRPEASDLVLAALNDPDSGVQATAVRQLRPRQIPNALQLLVARLDSPQAEVREAARSSLAEFNFMRYRAMFDLLDDIAVRTTGALVRQVDPTARERLVEEIASPSTSTRIRGIEMAMAMGAVDDVCEQLITLARHVNPAVRKEAVAALAFATGSNVIDTLQAAANDSNRIVADAARQSLATLGVTDTTETASAALEAIE